MRRAPKKKRGQWGWICIDVLTVNFVKQFWSPNKNAKSHPEVGDRSAVTQA